MSAEPTSLDQRETLPSGFLYTPVPKLDKGQTRLKDADACKGMVWQVCREDEPRSYRRALAKACYDRNPPMSKVPPGYSWTCNMDFGWMEGLLDSMRVPYYALLHGAPTYCTFKTNYQRDNPEVARWEEIIAEEWTDMLNRWKQFKWHTQARDFEMLFEGWGPVLFESPTDWRFTSIPARCIKVPQGAYSVLDDRLPFVVVMRDYRVHELFEKISNEEAATAAGWNVQEVKYAVTHAFNSWGGNGTNPRNDYEYWQQMLKNGDVAYSYTQADVVRCGMVFLKEYGTDGNPGRISVFIVTVGEANTDQDPTKTQSKSGFLYRHVGQYESYEQALNVYFQNSGDGTWHSVTGAGLKSFRHIAVMNRLMCRTVDNAFLAAMPIIKPGSNKAKDSMQLMVMGPVGVLAPDADIAQTRLAADIQGVLGVNRTLENNLAQNIGHYNQRSIMREDGRGEQPTAEAVRTQAAKESALNNAQIDNHYDYSDITFAEMFRRAMATPDSEAKRMIDQCLKRGVPREALDDMCYVKANRLSGYPSPQQRERVLTEMMGIKGALPVAGQFNLLNEFIGVKCGPDKIPVFNPKLPQPDVDAALAQIENSMLTEGVSPITPPQVNNATHLEIHLGFAEERMEPLRVAMEEEGQIPPEELEEAYGYIAVLGPHCQEHLDMLAQDPSAKDLHAQFKAALGNVASFHGRLYNAIRQARRDAQQAALEQQNATALGVMDQAKLASTEAQIQRDNLKTAADIRRKDAKTQHSMELQTWKTGQQTRLKAAQTQADTQIKKQQARANGSKE